MKKKKKKSLSGDIPGAAVVKKAANSFWPYALVALGLGVGLWALKRAPKTNIAFLNGIVDKMLPGASAIALAWYLSDQKSDYFKKAAWGVGGAGALDIIRKVIGDKFPSLSDLLPTLAGVPLQGLGRKGRRFAGVPLQGQAAAINVGDFPPSYYRTNAFQGVSAAYALGNSQPYALGNPNKLMGTGAYAMN
jgi:hypothetical protein